MADYQKGVRYETAVLLESVESGKEGLGFVEGYAAAFGSHDNLDLQGQFIYPGAFAKTVKERLPGLALMVRHVAHGGGDQHVIGSVPEGREDDYGLFVRGEYDESDLAQETRKAVNDGGIQGMSVGYEIIKANVEKIDDRHIVGLKELKLLDVIVTATPANPDALILSAKSLIENVEAVCTGKETSRKHFGKEEIRKLSTELRTAADRIEAAVSEPSCTAKAAAAHYEARVKRLRYKLKSL